MVIYFQKKMLNHFRNPKFWWWIFKCCKLITSICVAMSASVDWLDHDNSLACIHSFYIGQHMSYKIRKQYDDKHIHTNIFNSNLFSWNSICLSLSNKQTTHRDCIGNSIDDNGILHRAHWLAKNINITCVYVFIMSSDNANLHYRLKSKAEQTFGLFIYTRTHTTTTLTQKEKQKERQR